MKDLLKLMKDLLKWTVTIIVFIITIPLFFLFFCLLATIQQGHSVNGIIQAGAMLICSIGASCMLAKTVYKKL